MKGRDKETNAREGGWAVLTEATQHTFQIMILKSPTASSPQFHFPGITNVTDTTGVTGGC